MPLLHIDTRRDPLFLYLLLLIFADHKRARLTTRDDNDAGLAATPDLCLFTT